MSRLFLLIIFLLSQNSYAFERNIFVGIGFLSKNIASLTGSTSGETGLFTSNFLQLVLSGYFKLSDSWFIAPSLTATPFGPQSPEGGETFRIYTLTPRMAYDLGSSTDIHLGPGLHIYQIYGVGGTAVVNNGNTPVNFPLPDNTSHSINLMVDLGIGYEKQNLRIEIDILMTGLINRRTTNIILSLTYGIS